MFKVHQFSRLILVAIIAISLFSGLIIGSPIGKQATAAVVPPTVGGQITMREYPLRRYSMRELLGNKPPPAAPLSPQIIGTGGAEMQISPAVIDANSGYSIVGGSGFEPGENITLYILSTIAPLSLQADANGFFALEIGHYTFQQQFWFKAVGNNSGRTAGDGIVAAAGGVRKEGAALPHAVRHGDKLLLVGTGYTAFSTVAARRGLSLLGTSSANAQGDVAVQITTANSGPDGSAAYNLTIGGNNNSLNGASIEERGDAGPPYHPNNAAPTRGWVDQATGLTAGAYYAVGGEGFQPGETVLVTRLSDNATLLTMPVNAQGVAAASLSLTATQATAIDMRLDGLSSGRVAWASVLLDSTGSNRPAILALPQAATSVQPVRAIFTKLPPNIPITIFDNDQVYTATTSSANGLITTTISYDPLSLGDVHSISSDGGNANTTVAVGAHMILGTPDTTSSIFGFMSDASTTLGITGTVTISGTGTNTNGDGTYIINNISVGTYIITGTANLPCYETLSQTVSIDSQVTQVEVNFPLRNLCITPTPSGPTATSAPPTNTPPPATATTTATPLPPTSTPAPTNTLAPTNTPGGATDTPAPTNTVGATDTPAPTNTLAPTITPGGPTVTPTDCANPFVDLNGNIFYPAIHYLYCRGVVNGTDATHYTPAGTSTRGQFAKVVVLGFGLNFFTPSGGQQSFTDVPPSYFAFVYIETGYANHILSGFDAATCASIGATFPCYGPNRPITRAQLTKLVVGAAHYPPYTPTTQTFSDVGPSNVFYVSIETAHNKGVINGYPDNTFRPNNNIRRDEMAQIVYKGVTTP